MSENKKSEKILKQISENLSKSIEMLEVLDEISDGERKTTVIIEFIKENLISSYDSIETWIK